MTRMRSLVRPLLTFVLLWLSYFLLNTVIGPSWVSAAILAAVLVVIALIDWPRCPMLTRAYAHTLEHLDLGVGARFEEVIRKSAVGDDGVHV